MTKFKVGDKVKLGTKNEWFAPANRKHAPLGTIATVTKVHSLYGTDYVDLSFPDGLESKNNRLDYVVLAVDGGALGETIAEIDAKLQAAVQAQAEARKDRDAAQEAVEEAQRTAKVRIRDAKSRMAKADDLIIAYGNQIVKLKELEAKPPAFKPGDTVRVVGDLFTRQWGTVLSVTDGRIRASGGFYGPGGQRHETYVFSPEELEVMN